MSLISFLSLVYDMRTTLDIILPTEQIDRICVWYFYEPTNQLFDLHKPGAMQSTGMTIASKPL